MGYDTSLFLNPVHKELLCSICFGVFEKPVFLPFCGHVFCSECISSWLSQNDSQKTCPMDKKPIRISKEDVCKKKVPYSLMNIISDQIVFCKYRIYGCKATFSLSAFTNHLSKCKFKPANADEADSSINNLSVNSPSTTQKTVSTTNKDTTSTLTPDCASTSTGIQLTQSKTKATTGKPNNLCKLAHPSRNDNASTYFHLDWKHPNKNLVKLTFLSIYSSYKPYTLASYIKLHAKVDVYCIHTDIKFENNLTKDLSVYVLEEDCEKVMNSDIWPSKVTINANLGLKQITVKGALKTMRRENFYGFNERDDDRKQRKELKKKAKIERLAEKPAKKRKRKNKPKKEESTENANVDKTG